MEKSSIVKKFLCALCGKAYCKSSSLQDHIRLHSEDKPFMCDICAKTFRYQSTLYRHLKDFHKDHVVAKVKEVNNVSSLKGDNDFVASQTGEILDKNCEKGKTIKDLECLVCNKVLACKSSFRRHVSTHLKEKRLQCEFCNATFRYRNNLENHEKLRVSNGTCPVPNIRKDLKSEASIDCKVTKATKCSFCSLTFPSPSRLQEHMRRHTGEKPYECDFCKIAFGHRSTLRRHLRTVHKANPTSKKLKVMMESESVEDSGENCTEDNLLNENDVEVGEFESQNPNMWTITDEQCKKRKIIKCSFCSMTFSTLYQVKEHTRIHTGEKPYECDFCEMKFRHLGTAQRHIVSVHKKIPAKRKSGPRLNSMHWKLNNEIFETKSGSNTQQPLPNKSENPFRCDVCQLEFMACGAYSRHMKVVHKQCLPVVTKVNKTLCLALRKKIGLNNTQKVSMSKKLVKRSRCYKRRPVLVESEVGDTDEDSEKMDSSKLSTNGKAKLKHKAKADSNSMYNCTVCGVSVSYTHHLVEHMRLHTGEKPFKCELCEKSFRQYSSIYRHMKGVHKSVQIFKCRKCHKFFSSKLSLENHCVEQHVMKLKDSREDGEESIGKNPSDVTFAENDYEDSLDNSKEVEDTDKYYSESNDTKDINEVSSESGDVNIDQCSSYTIGSSIKADTEDEATDTQLLKSESRSLKVSVWDIVKHSSNPKVMTAGKGCFLGQVKNGRTCVNDEGLKKSKQAKSDSKSKTTKINKCTVCNTTASFPHHLQEHMRLRKGEKLFKCDYCENSFKHCSSFSRHMKGVHKNAPVQEHVMAQPADKRVGSSSNNEVANDDSDYRESSDLGYHYEAKTRTYTCAVCSTTTTNLSHLKEHMRLHTGEKPFQCDFCQMAFRQYSSFSRHVKVVHKSQPVRKARKKSEKIKVYQCKVCFETLPTKHRLTRHNLKHHKGKKPYECNVCKVRFRYQSALSRHAANEHTNGHMSNMELSVLKSSAIEESCVAHVESNPRAIEPDNTIEVESSSVLENHKGIETITNNAIENSPEMESSAITENHKGIEINDAIENFPTMEYSAVEENHKGIETGTNKAIENSPEEGSRTVSENHEPVHVIHGGGNVDLTQSTDLPLENDATENCGKKYKCTVCNKRVSQRHHLAEHMRTHTGEKPHRCDFCGTAFRHSSSLIRHLYLHQRYYRKSANTVGVNNDGYKSTDKSHKGSGDLSSNGDKVASSSDALNDDEVGSSDEVGNDEGVANLHETAAQDEPLTRQKNNGDEKKEKTTKIYECTYCNKTASSVCHMQEHIRTHTGEKPFHCDTCGRSFGFYSSFTKHCIAIHKTRPTRKSRPATKQLNCTVCLKKISSQSRLEEHMRMHTGEKPLQCDDCGKKFRYSAALNHHLKVCRKVVVPLTDEIVENCEDIKLRAEAVISEVLRSRQDETGIDSVKPQCTECGKVFRTIPRLREHMLVHTREKPYKCYFCELTFRFTSTRLRHIKKFHEGCPIPKREKIPRASANQSTSTLLCPTCGKTFSSERALKQHSAVHDEVKAFECEFCHRKFRYKTSLFGHLKTRKLRGECPLATKRNKESKADNQCRMAKVFKCELCSKIVKQEHHLREHMRVHTGEKPYSCAYCGKSFRHCNSFYRHVAQLHKVFIDRKRKIAKKYLNANGNKTVLTDGHSTVSQEHHLQSQVPQCSSETLNRCDYCNMTFSNRSSLHRHALLIHRQIHVSESNDRGSSNTDNKPSVDLSSSHSPHKSNKGNNTKIFKCVFCGGTFTTNGHLQVHMRIHLGVLPFECEFCHKRFRYKSNVNRHLKSRYQHGLCPVNHDTNAKGNNVSKQSKSNKIFQCSFCDKTFTRLFRLQDHTRQHTGEKPFQCGLCPLAFARRSNLNRHLKTVHKICLPNKRTKNTLLPNEQTVELNGTIIKVDLGDRSDSFISLNPSTLIYEPGYVVVNPAVTEVEVSESGDVCIDSLTLQNM